MIVASQLDLNPVRGSVVYNLNADTGNTCADLDDGPKQRKSEANGYHKTTETLT